jgi:hypothetical protein
LVSLTALVAILFLNDDAFAGGGGYKNCNTVNFGPSCFATYNNHHLRIWDPDGSRPNFTARQKIDLWNSLLDIHLVDNQNNLQSRHHQIDPKDVFHDLDGIVDNNLFLRNILQDWKPVESGYCLRRYSSSMDYIRAIISQESVTENSQRLVAARFLLSEPSGYCLNKRSQENHYNRISQQDLTYLTADILGPDPSSYKERFAEIFSWLRYLVAAMQYNDRSYFLNPKEIGDLILAFEKIGRDNRSGWLGEASSFTSLQLRFEIIQNELEQSPFYDFSLLRHKYEDFLL